MNRLGIMMLAAALLCLPITATAQVSPMEWMTDNECKTVSSIYPNGKRAVMLTLLYTGQISVSLAGSLATEDDRQNPRLKQKQVLTVNGVKLLTATKYAAGTNSLLQLPMTQEGQATLREAVRHGKPVTFRYYSNTATAYFPPLAEGERALAECKLPL
ncbi:hypothetical protein [Aeromonas veronii]|uniref:hypothetical protein n=1 Tax=Aeromonas veronii TaxID=654 RepID=UPI002B46D8D8|nr:hypothetical protein [Aeromonas veronii]